MGAGQQQVRNLDASVGAFDLKPWAYSPVEVWAWDEEGEGLVDRSRRPWGREPRRPSHADRRKAVQREVLREEIAEALGGQPDKEMIRALAERLPALAARDPCSPRRDHRFYLLTNSL